MKACAYVVGSGDGPGAALSDMARTLGFDTVLPFQGAGAAERQALATPLCFFLFAAVPDVSALAATAESIRFCASRRVRFSPMMYFAESASLETTKRCLNLGFDDIVTLPFSRGRVEERLRRQIGHPLVYYETASYFGPDRRDREGMPPAAARPAGAQKGGRFRRLEIVRSLLSGISVLRDQVFEAEAPTFYL